jgi:hypothetical protein
MAATSVAIWKGNVVAVVGAAIIWVINSAFLIQGKSPVFRVSDTLPI